MLQVKDHLPNIPALNYNMVIKRISVSLSHWDFPCVRLLCEEPVVQVDWL